MFWFKKRRQAEKRLDSKQVAVSIEVQNHKNATQAAIKETQETTDKFNKLLKKNGITLKIHIATGGHHGR